MTPAVNPPIVLVTGGAGYIGRFCLRHLVSAGYDVVVLDRRRVEPANREPAVEYVVGDIADRELVDRLLANRSVRAVVHLAAEKSVEQSMAEPGAHLLNNVGGSLALFETMRSRNVRKVVFSSSAAVYGTPARLPVDEQAPLAPENPYGAGKVMVERILHWYHLRHGFDTVSLRYFNAAGAAADGTLGEEGEGATNLIPKVMRALAGRDESLPIFGTDFDTPDGTAIRDYVHVEDLATAHLRALELVTGAHGEWVFNLGAGRGYSVLEVLEAAQRATGREVPRRAAARRAGDPAEVWADVAAARQGLHWRAERDLDDIVRSAWLWQSRHNG